MGSRRPPKPCYQTQTWSDDGSVSYEAVVDGELVLSAFDSDGMATGTMKTTEGIVPLSVKKCP